MGGFTAFCDPKTGLAIAVLKSCYESAHFSAGKPSQDVIDICKTIRHSFGFE
jgi:hypothetical protein